MLAAARQGVLKCTLPVMIAFTAHPAITSSPGNLHLCQRCACFQTSGRTRISGLPVVCAVMYPHGARGHCVHHMDHMLDILLVDSTADPYIVMNRHTEHSRVDHGRGVHSLQLMVSWI